MLDWLMAAAAATFLLSSTAAFAGEAEGKIRSIDRDQATLTLDNGSTYKLPGEFDLDAVQEGMDILLAYDEVGGENLITDMQISE